jgi:hypothetical protein
MIKCGCMTMLMFECPAHKAAPSGLNGAAPRMLAMLRKAHSEISGYDSIDNGTARDIYDLILEIEATS